MNVRAKVLEVGMLVSGQSDNGTDWEKQQVVVETMEMEPIQLAIDFMGERKTQTTKKLKAGDVVDVNFGIRCRKWADKWFTNLDGRSIKLVQVLDAGAGQEEVRPTPPEMPVSEEELDFGK